MPCSATPISATGRPPRTLLDKVCVDSKEFSAKRLARLVQGSIDKQDAGARKSAFYVGHGRIAQSPLAGGSYGVLPACGVRLAGLDPGGALQGARRATQHDRLTCIL